MVTRHGLHEHSIPRFTVGFITEPSTRYSYPRQSTTSSVTTRFVPASRRHVPPCRPLASIYSLPQYLSRYPIPNHCDSIINITTSTPHNFCNALAHPSYQQHLRICIFPFNAFPTRACRAHLSLHPPRYCPSPALPTRRPSLTRTRGVVLFATIDSRKEEF
ncbi:hypothetical protein BDY19DRAFT_772380 [Irpex rosettiformis]|uniref:Uncharacterized protein n=1 Tax=Irpex rosettiformis TaxID=378272 RepID=A0ACB8U876_9APHY|nr:hypothetical protein BDY19DRAFT_772380 [Irpex rosettiformis]